MIVLELNFAEISDMDGMPPPWRCPPSRRPHRSARSALSAGWWPSP